MVPSLITLEEHFFSPGIRSKIEASGQADPHASLPKHHLAKLMELGDDRIQDMDEGKVNIQVLSHSSLNASLADCIAINDELAATCKSQPRFRGFAMLPMHDPEKAAHELTRCVEGHKFLGALINNHVNGVFYDDSKFWTVFARAEALGVPIYIHPTFAAEVWTPHYQGNYPALVAKAMGNSGWGWHVETGLHIFKLWASGLFDKHPKVKIIIGHMGEMLPFQLDRSISRIERGSERQRSLRTVWEENLWITTSGMFSLAPMLCLLRVSSVDRIMYSVDYPHSSTTQGLEFIEELERSDEVSKEDLDKICYKNAESLLGIKVVRMGNGSPA